MSKYQQESKTKKSYFELMNEFKTVSKKMAVVFVPQLANALKEENPDWDIYQLKSTLLNDCVENGWNEQYIERVIRIHVPQLNEGNINHFRSVNSWKTKHANKLIAASQKFTDDTKDIPLPPEPKETTTEEEEEEKEQFNQELQGLGLAPYGETGKSPHELTGDISEHAYKLFAALTNMKSPPNTSSDLLVEYIRPSREFRKGLMLEVDSRRRINIHNALHYASVAIEDMIEIIKEIENKN